MNTTDVKDTQSMAGSLTDQVMCAKVRGVKVTAGFKKVIWLGNYQTETYETQITHELPDEVSAVETVFADNAACLAAKMAVYTELVSSGAISEQEYIDMKTAMDRSILTMHAIVRQYKPDFTLEDAYGTVDTIVGTVEVESKRGNSVKRGNK